MSPYVICMHCSLYEERWLCDWLFSLFMVEDLAQMSLLGLITLPSVAHAPSHCSTLLFSEDIRLKAGALKDRLVNNGLSTPAQPHGSLPHSITNLNSGCTFSQVS